MRFRRAVRRFCMFIALTVAVVCCWASIARCRLTSGGQLDTLHIPVSTHCCSSKSRPSMIKLPAVMPTPAQSPNPRATLECSSSKIFFFTLARVDSAQNRMSVCLQASGDSQLTLVRKFVRTKDTSISLPGTNLLLPLRQEIRVLLPHSFGKGRKRTMMNDSLWNGQS